jgi:assimilatory nitrate reductase catalytic subunit
MVPSGPYYWARVPLEQGHAFTLRGWEPLPGGPGSEAWVGELLGRSTEPVIYADPRRGVFRYAALVDDRLEACLFIAPMVEDLPTRDALGALLGGEISPAARVGLLAGSGAANGSAGDAGRTVCACFAVKLRTLHETITERRLTSVAEIGAALHAGTNCGSCIPELRAMLRGLHIEGAALAG